MNEINTFRETNKKKNLTKTKYFLIEKYGACQICGMNFKSILQIHHIQPISTGGSDEISNLAVLCPNCHKTIHAIDGNFYDGICDDDYMDDWMDYHLSSSMKQAYLNYAYQILKSRYNIKSEEVMSGE